MTTATRVLVGQSALLTFTAYQDGTETDLGTITIGIVDANGDTVVASGTAVTDNSDGTYTYTLAKQTEVNFLIATWSVSGGADFESYVDVVGSELFNETTARAFAAKADATSALKPLASEDEYPDSVIAGERDRITDDLEQWTGRSFISRYARLELKGTGSSVLSLRDGKCVRSDGYHLNRPGS